MGIAQSLPGDIDADPFGERALITDQSAYVLGGRFRFQSNSPRLLDLADQAYSGLPRQLFSADVPEFSVQLVLTGRRGARRETSGRTCGRVAPAAPRFLQGGGVLLGAAAESNFVVIAPRDRAALVALGPRMLHFPYHTRYEWLEFAVFTLAARAQRLVPLHAACMGLDGRGILLLGPSGAGKSTLSLHCLSAGLEFLSEDAVFIAPRSLRATGVANYLHIRRDSLASLARSPEAAMIRASPVITRRSGVDKFEVDLRRQDFQLARSPLKIVATVFLSARNAAPQRRLMPLAAPQLQARLCASQAYAASQPQWSPFLRRICQVPAFELRRGRHPADSVDALRALLAG
jgi:hypothetical protein